MSGDDARQWRDEAFDHLMGRVDMPHETAIRRGVGFALLALFEEQRTANLIAWARLLTDHEGVVTAGVDPNLIEARLGGSEGDA